MKIQTIYHLITKQKSGIRFKYSLLLIACCILTLSGCDDSFQPLKENNLYNFNISGYLDASADTQWVRVGTIRQSIDEPPNPTGIQVTLEDLQSGETVVMNDSVFTSRNVLNYWTTMDIEHVQTYRITAKGADGKASRVTVTTPKELPNPYIVNSGPPKGANIYIDDSVEHIADIQSVWYVILNPNTDPQRRIYKFPIRSTLKYTSAYFGAYYAFANHEKEQELIEQSAGGAEIEIVAKQFFVAAGGPEWDDSLSSVDDLEYFLDGTGSNVENGLGFLAGVDAKWFRQVRCLAHDRSRYIPCEPEEPFW